MNMSCPSKYLKAAPASGLTLQKQNVPSAGKDFLAKIYISLKECAETKFWIELLYETEYLTEEEFTSISKDCEELRRMLSATTKTLNSTLHSPLSTL